MRPIISCYGQSFLNLPTNMKLLWLFFVLPAVLGDAPFGRSYLKNSRLCHTWNCINTKLGLPDSLPDKNVAEDAFKRVLPAGPWQDTLGRVLNTCYGNRSRRYTNTCPGQALLHCVVDQLIDNCPEGNIRIKDACSTVSSLAGFRHMFSQSRYVDLEVHLPRERRPVWFLKHYFDQKCCDLPTIFNQTTLEECGFSSFMTYYTHEPRVENIDGAGLLEPTPTPFSLAQRQGDALKIAHLNPSSTQATPAVLADVDISATDPLECCDMKEFIQPSWRSECGFHLSWKGQERLVIGNNTPAMTTTEAPVTTTTAATETPKDLMLSPQSCEAESCVFRKLDIVTETGAVNTMAFMKLLDNFTDAHPTWKKAAARVVTKCLSRKVRDYDGNCEINKVLACTLDLLTENCPYKRKSEDSCKHNRNKTGCQISSSRLRPKNRREICLLPPLIHQDYLTQCDLESLYKTDHIAMPEPKPISHRWANYPYFCQDLTPSTACLMQKMKVLNKYNFMGYFQMKDRIRQFTSTIPEWSALLDIYLSAFVNTPMYSEHCSSQRKFMNVVDAMLMTCPVSRRVNSPQCTKIFKSITDTTPLDNQNATKAKLEEIMGHYRHMFLPTRPLNARPDPVRRRHPPKTVKKPLFNYGLFDSKDTPTVSVIPIKPVVLTRPNEPLRLVPVHLRDSRLRLGTSHNDGVFRSNPYWLHERIAQAHLTTPSSVVASSSSRPTTSTASNVSPPLPFESDLGSPLRMFKPE